MSEGKTLEQEAEGLVLIDSDLVKICQRLTDTGLFGETASEVAESLVRNQLIELATHDCYRNYILPTPDGRQDTASWYVIEWPDFLMCKADAKGLHGRAKLTYMTAEMTSGFSIAKKDGLVMEEHNLLVRPDLHQAVRAQVEKLRSIKQDNDEEDQD